MKSFLSSLRKLDSSARVLCDRTASRRQSQLFTTLLLSGAVIGGSIGFIADPATAAPARKDWCSTVWSVENQSTLAWINPTTGVTTTISPPPNLTMPTGSMGSAVAAIGIHAQSGTIFAFDRTGATGTLYKNTLGVNNSGWVSVPVTGLIGLTGNQTIVGASNNLNKMTVDGNTLFIAESNGVAVYSIPLNSDGTLSGTAATPAIYTFSGDPGVYQHRSLVSTDPVGTEVINGGDLTTDEYGDTYNITYNVIITGYNSSNQQITTTTKAYFYKQSGNTWVYQGEAAADANFAGAAFYKGKLYVKAARQFKQVDLTPILGGGYTGWSSPLTNIGLPSGLSNGSADLTACGTPNVTMTKTQQIYADAALTTLVADQTKVKTGQYIKYTITAQNIGTSWARNTKVMDSLPTGTTYVPNSASLNGTSFGFITYPTSGFVINAPGSAVGIVPYSTVAGADTATMSFAVQVTALNGAVQNQATVAYVDNSGLPSEPSVCTSPLLNCSVTPSVTVTPLDFGDAPDGSAGTATGNYRTTASDDGPSHVITAGLKLGATAPDADNGLQQNAAATADGADEDAFTTLPPVPATGTYSLTNVPVTNTTGTTATLYAWVDFNNNGSFEAGEFASATVANNATTANLTWTVPAGTVAGNTYARFRLTTQALIDNTATTAEDERSFGAASNGEVEDYPVTIADAGVDISGTIFEDPNYGGGAGRDLATPTTSPRDGAVVELYKNDGTYLQTATTSGGGKYKFMGIEPGDYQVRVVNGTVTSSRPGYAAGLLPVQTFRTTAINGTVIPVTDQVGGEIPKEIDAPANTTASLSTLNAVANQEVQSLTAVKLGTSNVTGIDFGYNFDTIVNTNNADQGSLRQFITNSNALKNTNLAQEGQTAGTEVSIFMISDGAARAGLSGSYSTGINGTGGNASTAVISLTSNFSITDNDTHLDATTQTTNVGDLNSGTVGTGGTVGVDGLALSTIPKPEVVLDLRSVPANTNAILVSGGNTLLKGFAIYGYRTTGNLATLLKGAIVINAVVSNSSPAIITQLLGGTMADGSDPGVPTVDVGYTLQTAGAANISNNYLAYNSDAITFENTNGTNVNFIDNEVAYNGPKNNNGSNASGIYADQIETVEGTKNITLLRNLIRDSSKPGYANSQGQGIQISYSSLITIENNTFANNNVYAINASSSDTTIQKNIITGTKNTGLGQGSGIAVYYGGPLNTGLRNRISQNSIYQNAKLGIDHQIDGVTPNNGSVSATQPNNGIDYPIITSSILNAGKLKVKGYVGSSSAGNAIFGNTTVELFVADDDGNNNGEVILNDTRLAPHGEGKTYIGTCTTDANGIFGVTSACEFTNAATLSLTNAKNITSTATDSLGNTSEFSSTPNTKAQLLLVKRVTKITNGVTGNVINYTTFVNDSTAEDNNCNWPTATGTTGACTNNYTTGAISPNKVNAGDEVEYTVYYLNSGENKATQARICDQLDANLTFQTQFDSTDTTTVGKGLVLAPGIAASQYLTNAIDPATDQGQFTTSASPLVTSCNLAANSGTNLSNKVVIVDVATPTTPLMGSVRAGIPTASYGYIRFKVKVN